MKTRQVGYILLMAAAVLFSTIYRPAEAARARSSAPGGEEYFRFIDKFGGYVNSLAVFGSYAYVNSGSDRLVVVDLSNPSQPRQVSSVIVDQPAASLASLASAGNYLYFGSNILDLSVPAHPVDLPQNIGSDPGVVSQVVGNNLYLRRDWWTLDIYNLQDPRNPALLGSTQISIDLSKDRFAVVGNILYSASTSCGKAGCLASVGIYDVANPAQPALLGNFGNWDSSSISLTHSGNFLYVAADILRIFSLQDPRLPVELPAPGLPADSSQNALFLRTAGQSLICACYSFSTGKYRLEILDISDPGKPKSSGVYPLNAQPFDLEIQGSSAVLLEDGKWLRILDLSHPDAPVELGASAIDQGYPSPYGAVQAAGGRLVTDHSACLGVWALQAPTAFSLLGEYCPENATGSPSFAHWTADAQFIYFAQGSVLKILPLSDPAVPIGELTLQLPQALEGAEASLVAVAGNSGYILFAWRTPDDLAGAALLVVDLSDRTHPVQVGSLLFEPGSMVSAMDADGDKVYLLMSPNRLVVVDASRPTAPAPAGSAKVCHYISNGVEQGCTLLAVKARAGRAYLLYEDPLQANRGVLAIYSIAEPAAMQRLGEYRAPGEPDAGFDTAGLWMDLELDGDTLQLVWYDDFWTKFYDLSGVFALDVSDPRKIKEVGRYTSLAQGIQKLAILDGISYLFGDSVSVLEYGYRLQGQVTDFHGRPAAEAVVTGSETGQARAGESSAATHTARTDKQGFFTLRGLPPGRQVELSAALGEWISWPPGLTVSIPARDLYQRLILIPAAVSVLVTPGSGASLSYTDLEGLSTRIEFLPGAFETETELSLTPGLTFGVPGLAGSDHVFSLELTGDEGARFLHPGTLSLQYSDLDVIVVSDEAKLALYRWDGAAWALADTRCAPPEAVRLDPDANTFTAPLCAPGLYAFSGPTRRVYLPVISR